MGTVSNEASYRPRSNPNRNRFNFDEMPMSDDGSDGIGHGVILPKRTDRGARSFRGYLIRTDSYHDGIRSYFPLDCSLAP